MREREASIATRRFGLGARPGDLARIGSDARGYVVAALERKNAARIDAKDLQPGHVSFAALREAQRAQREMRKADPSSRKLPDRQEKASADSAMGEAPAKASPEARPGLITREVFRDEAGVRIAHAVASDSPFVERLVMFWSSHFAVSAAKGPAVRLLAGAFEREAIRPHVLGRFADMLRAVVEHPAMLIYLDNARSIGPGSRVGVNRGKGLNENLAREILELHTLGVDGGYTQADVTSFARVLTGWSVVAGDPAPRAPAAGELVPGTFVFTPSRHEPGQQTILGKRYPDRGLETGEAVLDDLARHPATARHIARKLVRHFVGDKAPAAIATRLEAAFHSSGGDLAAVARALVESPEAWQHPPAKILPPYDFLIAVARALQIEIKPQEVIRLSAAIGQPLWAPPSPKGWPDEDEVWMSPSSIRERLRISERYARLADRGLDPRARAADLFGAALSEPTRAAIAQAEAREQGIELLLMSSEFQRR